MSEYTRSLKKDSNEYLSIAAKSYYVRDYLLSINSRLELLRKMASDDKSNRSTLILDEFASLINRRNEILDNPLYCYSDAEIEDFDDKNLPPKDMFVDIANDSSQSAEVRSTASDIVSIEDSVADAKLAYEIESNEFDDYVDATYKMLSVAEEVVDCGNPNLVTITPEDEERLQKANDVLKALKESPEKVNLEEEARKRAVYEIGKHPFSYALYAIKNDLKEIVKSVKEGRRAVKAAEGTMFDSIAASALAISSSVEGRLSDEKEMVLGAVRHAGVEVTKLLNKAYSCACEMFEKAKDKVLGIYRALNRKCEHITEVISLGAYSRVLESVALKASVAESKENPSLMDKLAIATMKLNRFEMGYQAENISDHIASLKKDVWGEDGKSVVDKTDEFADKLMFNVERATVEMSVELANFKKVALAKLDEAKSTIGPALAGFGDRISLEMKVVRVKVEEASLNLQASTYKAGVGLLARIHKLNEHRIEKLGEKIVKQEGRAEDLKSYIAGLEKGLTPEPQVGGYTPNKELVAAIEALRKIENKSTAEMFAERTLVNKLEKEQKKFETQQNNMEGAITFERAVYESEYATTMIEISDVECKIESLKDSIKTAQQKATSLVDKMAKWDVQKSNIQMRATDKANEGKALYSELKDIHDAEVEDDREM